MIAQYFLSLQADPGNHLYSLLSNITGVRGSNFAGDLESCNRYMIKIDQLKLRVLIFRILCQHRADGMIGVRFARVETLRIFKDGKKYCRGDLRTNY